MKSLCAWNGGTENAPEFSHHWQKILHHVRQTDAFILNNFWSNWKSIAHDDDDDMMATSQEIRIAYHQHVEKIYYRPHVAHKNLKHAMKFAYKKNVQFGEYLHPIFASQIAEPKSHRGVLQALHLMTPITPSDPSNNFLRKIHLLTLLKCQMQLRLQDSPRKSR